MTAPPRTSEPALAAIRQAGGDELVGEMLRSFGSFAQAQVSWLEGQLATRQYDSFAQAAHALGASAAEVGAHDVASACARAELAGAGHDAVSASQALEDVIDALDAAHGWIDELVSP